MCVKIENESKEMFSYSKLVSMSIEGKMSEKHELKLCKIKSENEN